MNGHSQLADAEHFDGSVMIEFLEMFFQVKVVYRNTEFGTKSR